jgi:hypothetical protein
MGTKLSAADAQLYRRIDEVLHYIWDPIGVCGAPGARDEYYAYLPNVYNLVRASASEQEIASYLLETEIGHMGLSSSDPEKAQRVAEICTYWRKWISEEGH